MLAIPSPDVLINLFASAGQMLGLLALALGGGALARKRSSIGSSTRAPASRWPFLACFCMLVAVSLAFGFYHLKVRDEQNQRLRANLIRSSTEAGSAVGDTSLKTLSFSGQMQHPRGVSTDQLAAWLEQQKPLNLVDVREPEEIEMGAIPGSWARRYPDLQADDRGLCVDGQETVLLCESGNRSSELCDWFFAKGTATHFLIGGYEKWVAESRPMRGARVDGTEIRATPSYPQKEVLLDTPAVVAMFTQQNAQFVDVRYPEDFAKGHLPGAINVPLRKLRQPEVDQALASLPARPIIAVCYDKRSSFYGLLLGLRLHRLGADFRGRYTVPYEFTLPTATASWVARWQAERAGDTLFGRVGNGVGAAIGWLADRVGLLAAILLAVLALRLAMLPFSLTAERDQWQQRRLQPRFARWREAWSHDPEVARRESLRALQAAGVSPLRNVLGALLQIVLFAAAFAGIDASAAARPMQVLWFDLGAADPLHLLPLAFAAVTVGFVRLQRHPKRGWLLPLAFAAIMTALVWQCRAAILLYLMASLGLMAVQTLLQRGWLERRVRQRTPSTRPLPPRELVTLREAAERPEFGNKAAHLGKLIAAGLPVPDGFAVRVGADLDDHALRAACRAAGIESAAVRSSALGEDGGENSMAGMFRTELEVAPADLRAAIRRVQESYGGRDGGVVVQAFRRASHAGVLFTIDPAHSGRMLVELVEGCGEALVSGRATPRSFRVSRVTGRLVADVTPPIPLAPLVEMARRVEHLFGGPQDIEWVCVDGAFQLVQARAITRLPGHCGGDAAVVDHERHRLLTAFADAAPNDVVLEQTELSELLPAPTTYSLALFQSLWEAGGAVDRACRQNGFPYQVGVEQPPMVVTAFGRTFVDVGVRRQRGAKALGAAASFRMASSAAAIEADWAARGPEQRRRTARLAAIDPARLDDAELLALAAELRRDFVESTYAVAETINMAADFFVNAARRRAERAGLDAAALLRDPDGNVVSRTFAALHGEGPADDRAAAFRQTFGHRAVHDFELAEPRYRECMPTIPAGGTAPRAPIETMPTSALPKLLAAAVTRARRFQALKEEAKHEALRELAVLRDVLCSIGDRFGIGDAVFDLLPTEVARLGDAGFRSRAQALAEDRAQRRQRLLAVELPPALTPAALESLGDADVVLPGIAAGLAGTCVAGSREVVGPVRVVHRPEELVDLRAGEILVTRCTDPCWLSAFRTAGGLVTEIGGWLSHAAIQAREHDLATIVGVPQATRQLRTGDVVRLQRDGVVVLIPERRSVRRDVDATGHIRHSNKVLPVRLLDRSMGGVCIEVADPSNLPDRFVIEAWGEDRKASVAWRNCRRAGVKFDIGGIQQAAQHPNTADSAVGG